MLDYVRLLDAIAYSKNDLVSTAECAVNIRYRMCVIDSCHTSFIICPDLVYASLKCYIIRLSYGYLTDIIRLKTLQRYYKNCIYARKNQKKLKEYRNLCD